MSAAQVAAVLGRYDDEAWTALASRGLLRRARKDLQANGARLICETPDGVEVAVGDQSVRMGVAGPGAAACSCPSTVTCQHIITAGLWLASAGAPQPAADVPAADRLHDELMAIDAAALISHAGLPGYRWAHQMLGDQPGAASVTREKYLAVTFERPPLTVRYLGGGLDGLVLDQPVPQPDRLRVAAVLAWQQAHGLVLVPPPSPPPRGRGESVASASRDESRARLRAVAAELLCDMVAVGVCHLSPAIRDRLTTAATWAAGAQYHRLALLLRRLADQVELLLARSSLADDLLLLDEIAVAHALVAALDAAALAGTELAALAGQARTSYDPVRSLDLIGLGGRPWRASSGYRGLTCVFWSPSREQFLTWTDARPDSLSAFDPRARWRQPGPWGLDRPAASAGRRVSLVHAQVSAAGRISVAESTAASVTGSCGDELRGLLPVRESWRELAPARARALSDPAGPGSQWTVLRPAQVLPPLWDGARQALRCALLDGDGEVLTLSVPWSALHAHAIGRLEALAGTLPPGALVVARVVRRRGQLAGEPLSLVLPGRAAGPVDALHFDDGPRPGPSPLVQRLLSCGAPDRAGSGEEDTGEEEAGPAPAVLTDLRALVEAQGQRGCAGVAPGVIHDQVARAHRNLRRAGLSVFTDPPADLRPPEMLLRSLFLVQQAEQVLGAAPPAPSWLPS